MEEAINTAPQASTAEAALDASPDKASPQTSAAQTSAAQTPASQTNGPHTDAARDAFLRAHFENLRAQADVMRQTYPGFDLEAELKDPEFFRWTAPEGRMTLKQAYMARHGDEMLAEAMRYASERTRERTMANVRAGLARPSEGGLSGSGGVMMDRDIAAMTRGERADIRQRVARGEKIVF